MESSLKEQLEKSLKDIKSVISIMESRIEELETENEELRERLEKSHGGRKLKLEDRKKISDFYISKNYTLTENDLKEFKEETGIEISDLGFRNVCREMGIYKSRKQKSQANRRRRARRQKRKKK